MHVSGIVSSELPVTSTSVVILDPTRSTFVAVASTIANYDGSFSVTIRIGEYLFRFLMVLILYKIHLRILLKKQQLNIWNPQHLTQHLNHNLLLLY